MLVNVVIFGFTRLPLQERSCLSRGDRYKKALFGEIVDAQPIRSILIQSRTDVLKFFFTFKRGQMASHPITGV